MPSTDILIALFIATAVFAYMPGPAMLYATAQTLTHGRRAGWLAALGIHIGGYVHVLAATFGLALVFQAVPALYLALKFAGAVYLIWLGLRMILAQPTTAHTPAKPPRNTFWQSITVEVLNPKTALFFVAFLPQFTDPEGALMIWAQLLILGTIVNLMFSSADVVCVLLADRLATTLKGSASRLAQRLGGGILIALGLNIAFRQA
ncbi:MAG: LysE family translocator [Roseicyclus sp.]|nr:LysE family translocator [Roseicyclus sp.]